ncbi:hypothetical protein LQZ18_18580 [Lachnospiraceae bacterium ZAX-1]
MNNKKKYMLYMLCLLISAAPAYIGAIIKPRTAGDTILSTVAVPTGDLLLFFLLLFVLMSWIHNIAYMIYFRHLGYNIESISLYPFAYTKSNAKGERLQLSPSVTWVSVFGCVQRKAAFLKRADIERYMRQYLKYLRMVYLAHMGAIATSGLLMLLNFAIGLSFMAALAALMACYTLCASPLVFSGLYEPLFHQERAFYVLWGMACENFDKHEVYQYKQDQAGSLNADMNLNEIIMMEEIVMDSICDHKDYVDAGKKGDLDLLFLSDHAGERKWHFPKLLRLYSVYRLYLKLFDGQDYKDAIEENAAIIKDGLLHLPKALRAKVGLRQVLDFRNTSNIYRGKLEALDRLVIQVKR